MVVAAAMDDGERPVLVEPLEADHRRMEPEAVGDLDDLALGNPELRPRLVVGGIAERHDGVQAVIAARQLDDHEDAVGMLLDARAFERLRGERRGRAVQDERQSRADAEAVHPSSDEVAAGTAAAHSHLGPQLRSLQV